MIEVSKEDIQYLYDCFDKMAERMLRLTSGNVAHQAPNVRLYAVSGMVKINQILEKNGESI